MCYCPQVLGRMEAGVREEGRASRGGSQPQTPKCDPGTLGTLGV